MILGLGRAIGEAIALLIVVGGGTLISANLFQGGNTLAAKIAAEFQGTNGIYDRPSIFYLAVILLVFSAVINLVAQVIIRRVGKRQGLA